VTEGNRKIRSSFHYGQEEGSDMGGAIIGGSVKRLTENHGGGGGCFNGEKWGEE